MAWSLVYKRAIEPDGSLLFPERLTREFLDSARKSMGSYFFANQYQNEVIPEDEKSFRPEWLRTYKEIPENTHRFAFIDPAIGQKKHHDFTAICVVDVDYQGNWYLRLAQRYKITPTEIINKMFELQDRFQLQGIGVEAIAYQEALLYFLDQEMHKRAKILPVKGIHYRGLTKQARILGLVPRFEWGRIFVAPGQRDFEDEYSTFPRGTFDDLLDALASLEEIVFYPTKKEKVMDKPHSPNDPSYEKWYISNLAKEAASKKEDDYYE